MKNHRLGVWVQASPTQYLLHYRGGKIIRQGMGLGACRLPVTDHFTLVPCTAQSLTFAADQITRENQGVEIAGFAVWKIAQPEITAQRFDFDDPDEPTKAIGACLKDVVESAIRHRVANMTIEEVLRKRASIILELKRELEYITAQWGLAIDTIEIKHVRIMSKDVFTHLQASYREGLRLESETSRLRTEQEIAVRQLKQKEECQKQETDLKAAFQEQEHSLLQQKATLEHERLIAAARQQLDLQREQFAKEVAALKAEHPVLDAREEVESVRRTNEAKARTHEEAMARLEAGASRLNVEADNQRRADLALIGALPEMFGNLKLGEVNLTPDLIKSLVRLISRERRAAA